MDPVNVKLMLGFMKEQKLQKLETLIREYEDRRRSVMKNVVNCVNGCQSYDNV